MRLAIVSHQGTLAAGAEHSLLQLLLRLPASVKPMIFLFEDGEFAQELRRRFGSVTIVKMSARVKTAERTRLPLRAVAGGAALVRDLTTALRRAAPDMVLTNSMKAHIVGSLAAKLAGIPCVNFVHDIVTGPARLLLQLVSRMCAVERLTCSKAVAASLGLGRTTTVYAPIEVASFAELPPRRAARIALGLPDDELPVVALVGRIARWKGQDRFIRIALKVIASTDAHFAIVGSALFGDDSGYLPELVAAVAEAGLQTRVHFVPWQDDMSNVYAAIDVSCNCSVREPFGRTSLEALAAGVPIVCFDDAGVSEIFEQGGTAVAPGDEAAFAAAIRSYLDNPQRMASAKVSARHAAAPLDIANVYRIFADVIQRVGQARAPQPSSRDLLHLTPGAKSVPR